MMPTTRYGRFLLYRSRAKKRLRKIENRRLYHNLTNVRATTAIDASGATKQNEKRADGPRHVGQPGQAPCFVVVNVVPAAYRRFAVYQDARIMPPTFNPAYHFRVSLVGYQNRRVLWAPRLKQLDRYYLMPLPAKEDHAVYPFMPYPSGARNPRGWKFRDGGGVVPAGWEGWHGNRFVANYLATFYPTPNNVDPALRAIYPDEAVEWTHWPFVP